MYPSRFRYEAPTHASTRRSPCCATASGEAKVLAGGQSLVPLMKLRFASPELLVDINNLPGLDHLEVDADGTIRIGALCRHADLERSAVLAGQAADDGRRRAADRRPDRAQPRHAGRLAVPRRPAGRLGLRWSPRSAATWSRRARGGRRTIAITDFVTGPFPNVLDFDEIAVEAVIPAPKGTARRRLPEAGAPGRRLRDRRAWPSSVDLVGGRVTRAGIALTGVGGSTIDAREAADVPRRAGPRRRRASAAPPTWPPRPPSRRPTTAAARSTSATSSTRSSPGS